MGPDPIGPVPVNTETFQIHRSLVDIRSIRVHESMQTGVQIPQKNDGPIMLP